jgi:DNA-binding NtrC family response regulator
MPERGGVVHKGKGQGGDSGSFLILSFLWKEDLAELRPLLETIAASLEDILTTWYQLYTLQFSETRSLTESEFKLMYRQPLAMSTRALIEGRVGDYAACISELGEKLADCNVSFQEVIASLHLFWLSALRSFSRTYPLDAELYRVFDKLNHVRMTILSDAYFRRWVARLGVRISQLERDAAIVPTEHRSSFHGLVGAAPAMRELYRRIAAAGKSGATILIFGESGTGKELVAHAIHECGPDPAAPFVALNCAALSNALIESELFGYKRGAFSGAAADHLGLFRAAEGGTLLLDEITEMSIDTQSKLLRALQERKVRPVGATQEVPVAVRVIASTNRDPEEAVRSGHLRADLYYRLQANVLRIPPLRERIDDIPLLTEHFITIFNERALRRIPISGIEDEALRAMQRYSWPGNVRELSNTIESAFTFGNSPRIRLLDLSAPVRTGVATPQALEAAPVRAPAVNPGMDEMERELIRRALEKTGGNKSRAARLLGISRKKLYDRIERYRLRFQ